MSTIVPSLLEATKYKKSLEVRSLAVECLTYLPAHVPFHKIYPFRIEVSGFGFRAREFGVR